MAIVLSVTVFPGLAWAQRAQTFLAWESTNYIVCLVKHAECQHLIQG